MRNAVSHVAMIGLALGFVAPALAIEPQSINWSKIPTKEIRLFYPGLSTYDWLLSPAHAGAKMVAQGQACLTCHKGTEKTRGEKIVKGGDLEPAPIPADMCSATRDVRFVPKADIATLTSHPRIYLKPAR